MSTVTRHATRMILLLLITGMFLATGTPVVAQGGTDSGGRDFSGRIPAPPFPEGLDWINVPGPLTWEDLRGKVVLLDFWTYGCINCIHVIPDLKRLEQEFPDELVVIGVHSGKFSAERETDNIEQIVRRYEITHPVVNDEDFRIWEAWGIQAWPTLMLVDPHGMVYGYHAGEGAYPVLQPLIVGMVAQFSAQGEINREPLAVTPVMDIQADGLLAFPGKVLADADNGRLFIADTNHHRIVVLDLASSQVLDVIGGPQAGFMDGNFAVARFRQPQGMALAPEGDVLYVADTGNHAVRAIDLTRNTVMTIVGTGHQARTAPRDGVGPETALNSPWDVAVVDDGLLIAMAGSHQIWRYDVASQRVTVYVGSGREGLHDGPILQAEMAQPSGLAVGDGKTVLVADSEASAIREIDLGTQTLRTLIGTGLFDFGDADGIWDDAFLQHPLGVAYGDGRIFVADTYNNKIKVIDLEAREIDTLAGESQGGFRDGSLSEALFDEPGGLSFAEGILYVADTNNHAVRRVDLAAGVVETISFANPDVLQGARDSVTVAASPGGKVVELPVTPVGAGLVHLELVLDVPEGYKLNTLAPSSVVWQVDDAAALVTSGTEVVLQTLDEPVQADIQLDSGETVVTASSTLYYCEAVNESLCFIERVNLLQPLVVQGDVDNHTVEMRYTVVPPTLD